MRKIFLIFIGLMFVFLGSWDSHAQAAESQRSPTQLKQRVAPAEPGSVQRLAPSQLLLLSSYSARLDLASNLGSICNNCALPSSDILSVDRGGYIYLKNQWKGIAVFNKAGQKVREFGGTCRLDQPASSLNCPDPDGAGPLRPGDGQFGEVGGLGIAPNGNVYVSDSSNHRIVVFDSAGRYVGTFGSKGSGAGQLNGPRHLDIADNGRVYVSDYYNRRIQVFNGDGSFYKSIQLPGSWAYGLAPAPRIRNGSLYTMALDFSGCTMRVLSLEGDLLQEYEVCKLVLRGGATGFSAYDDFEVDTNGNYYFLDIYESGNAHWGYITVTDSSFRKIANYGTIHEPRGIFLENFEGFPKLYIASYLQGSTRLVMFNARQLLPNRINPVQVVGDPVGSSQALNDPNDLSVSRDTIYVLDRNNRRIAGYDLQGRLKSAHPFSFDSRPNTNWGNNELIVRAGKFILAEASSGRVTTQNMDGTSKSEFFFNQETPYTRISALEVTPNGEIYLAGKNQEVALYTSTGQLKATYNCNALYPGPAVALKYDPWNAKLYAASRKAVAIIASDGSCAAVPTRYFGPDGTFDMFGGDIQSITIDSKQRIYVLQSERVQVFDRNWNLLGKFGAPGTGSGELSGSIAIDAGPGEHVFVLQSRWGFSDGISRQRYQAFKFFPGPAVLGVDSDGDGIPDALDQCPVDGGVVDSRGCPYATGSGGPQGSN